MKTKLTTWVIDPLHSEVQFKIRHLVISTVSGSFNIFEGRVVSEGEGFANAKVYFTIDVKSIHTNQAQRDAHLQNSDFFAADLYPQITFESTSFVNTGDNRFKMIGDLTLKDVTKSVELNVEYGGAQKSKQGGVKKGFFVTGLVKSKKIW